MPLGGSSSDAFKLVLNQRYLGLIAIFSLLFTLVKTNGDYVLAKIVAHAASSGVIGGHIPSGAVAEYIGAAHSARSYGGRSPPVYSRASQ